MKIKLLFIIFFSLLLVSCNKREKDLEAKLAETENRLNDAVSEIQKLTEMSNYLKKENEKLSKQLEARNVPYKPPVEPKATPIVVRTPATPPVKTPVAPIVTTPVAPIMTPVAPTIGKDEIKSFLYECNSLASEMQRLLLELRNVDNQKITTDKNSDKDDREKQRNWQKEERTVKRNQIYKEINQKTSFLQIKITNTIKDIPLDNSNAKYRQAISNVGQCVNIVTNNINMHKQSASKTQMDKCVNNALNAVDKIQKIANNF